MVYTHDHGVVQKDKNKLVLFLVAIGFAIMAAIGILMPAWATHNETGVTFPPSTNDENRTNGNPHVNVNSEDVGEVTLDFVNDTNALAVFEYRIDGEELTSGDDHPVVHGDFIYPNIEVDSRNTDDPDIVTETFEADEYIEVRLALGGERDWDFDWTRFDVLAPPAPEPTGEITSPSEGEMVSGVVNLTAIYDDGDDENDDGVQWAVREGTCEASTGTVFGNVDGHDDPFTWDGADFEAMFDTTTVADGEYCFVFNPTDDPGQNNVRETRTFIVDNTAPNQVEGMTIFQNNEEIGCSAVVNERTITVDWNDSGDPEFDHYVYQADDGEGVIDFETTVVASERTGDIRDLDGTYQYRVAAVDTAGNQGEFSDWCMVTLDREAPVVDITSHEDGDTVNGTIEVRGSVEDDNPSHYFTIIRNDEGDTVGGPGTVNEDESFTDELLFEFDTTTVEDGEYELVLAARDEAGNRDDSAGSLDVVDITIDNGDVLGEVNEPENKQDCKNGGWENLTNAEGEPFVNQGDCVSYVASANNNGWHFGHSFFWFLKSFFSNLFSSWFRF